MRSSPFHDLHSLLLTDPYFNARAIPTTPCCIPNYHPHHRLHDPPRRSTVRQKDRTSRLKMRRNGTWRRSIWEGRAGNETVLWVAALSSRVMNRLLPYKSYSACACFTLQASPNGLLSVTYSIFATPAVIGPLCPVIPESLPTKFIGKPTSNFV